MELGSALAIPDPARDPGGSGVGRWENLSLSRIEEVLKAPLVPRGARNWLQDLGETRQGPGGGVPPPKALTTSVVLGTEGVSTGDLKRSVSCSKKSHQNRLGLRYFELPVYHEGWCLVEQWIRQVRLKPQCHRPFSMGCISMHKALSCESSLLPSPFYK